MITVNPYPYEFLTITQTEKYWLNVIGFGVLLKEIDDRTAESVEQDQTVRTCSSLEE